MEGTSKPKKAPQNPKKALWNSRKAPQIPRSPLLEALGRLLGYEEHFFGAKGFSQRRLLGFEEPFFAVAKWLSLKRHFGTKESFANPRSPLWCQRALH